RAWCPRCFQEWRHDAMPIYECLAWALTPVTVCPIHDILLEQSCPYCGHRMLPLSAHAHPGFCAHCSRWLGDHSAAPDLTPSQQIVENQLSIAKEVGEFVALGATVSDKDSPSHLLSNLQRMLSELANGNQRLFGRVAKISDSVLKRWLMGKGFPS